ncbi:MAG: hypothetical protein ACK56F_14085, partial [bacterium]
MRAGFPFSPFRFVLASILRPTGTIADPNRAPIVISYATMSIPSISCLGSADPFPFPAVRLRSRHGFRHPGHGRCPR